MEHTQAPIEYAGFWIRVAASIIDTVLVMLATVPLLVGIYGFDYFDIEKAGQVSGPAEIVISWVLPAIAIVLFWIYRQATPGKSILGLQIQDANTGGPLSPVQSVARYLGYFASTIPLCLGLIWVGFDPKKQGWHDKIAQTVVVKKRAIPS
jgi:uncharacterized RDD family membrane protein YckC